ncbi:ribosome assembly RNA-binding protein YhbY [Alkalibacter rhizosphaerae]|uniref:Ribosome assembly RNA-binding protein YhbY n=1 Tax=Alkalibacter rhizosphaerae TaxID=2815577 RepID=A0A974XEC9_9FIRM|nr:ribosome assembly RNA-binding protein YhbY [Alkalibacter rhizosphaerae]QSX08201.1 ribosome assembly RNA-binding protein YhbY [Alkalibacter rhizosphaerae]
MLTSKQRSYFRSLAVGEPDILHVGKEGLNANLVVQAKDALKSRELIKGKVQQNCMEDVATVAEDLARSTDSDVVQVIGSKFVLYKRNHMDPKIELPKKAKK